MATNKRISILLGHTVKLPATTTGGVEKVFEEIFNKWDDANYEFNLICRGDVKKDKVISVTSNKEIIFLKGYKWSSSKFLNVVFSFFWCLQARKYLQESDFIIYNSVFGPLIHIVFRLKGLTSYCDQRGTGKVNYLIPSFTLDRLYAISQIVRNSWGNKYSHIIKIIPNCIDINYFKFIERYRIKNDSYIIVFIGRIIAEKGVIFLLEALNLLKKKYNLPNIYLNIIGPYETSKGGDPVYYEKCKNYVRKNDLESYIGFTGEKTSKEINYYLSKANIFAMSSIWAEAFGIVNIEALATGLPIVGYKKGALPEIIENEKEGFIVEQTNAESLAEGIVKHYNLSREKKIIMEKNCRRKAEYYDSKKIAHQYLEDIKEFLT
jgi:glycosyltransferase involved in cell wall biosynthesis